MKRWSWWALAAAVVAAIGVHMWLDVLPSRPETPPVVAAVDRAEVAGQELRYVSLREGEFEAPDGSRTVSVRFDASGGAEADLCTILLHDATGRTWKTAPRDDVEVPYDLGESECSAEEAPYDIVAVFLVPDDAAAPFTVDLVGDVTARFTIPE